MPQVLYGTETRRIVDTKLIDAIIARWVRLAIPDDRCGWLYELLNKVEPWEAPYADPGDGRLDPDSMEWFARSILFMGGEPPGGYLNYGSECGKASYRREEDFVILEWRHQGQGETAELMRFWVTEEEGVDYVGYLQHTPVDRSERLAWIGDLLEKA